jgi:hypothetical protein
VPSSRPSKPKAKAAKPAHPPPAKKPAKLPPKKAAPSKSAKPAKGASTRPAAPRPPAEVLVPVIPRSDGRRHLLSLSFVRDGDEFLARMETDSGHITELKNRALDQLLTLVAGELEDLLE